MRNENKEKCHGFHEYNKHTRSVDLCILHSADASLAVNDNYKQSRYLPSIKKIALQRRVLDYIMILSTFRWRPLPEYLIPLLFFEKRNQIKSIFRDS